MADNDSRIDSIRDILLEIEADFNLSEDKVFVKNFDALEVPEIVSTIIRYLQPLLKPYEAAVYWHMFDRAILCSGKQYCKVSIRGLGRGVALSSSGISQGMAQSTAQTTLRGLEEKGAIKKAGEPARDGTPYRVLLPEAIPACQERMKADVQGDDETEVDVAKDLDYYNVSENRKKVFDRDNYKCTYCGKQLTRFTATLDHVEPVSKGGDNSLGNLATACLHCNSRRGNRPVMDFIVETDGV